MAESDHNPDGWTFSTLYIHVMALSEASKQAVTAAMAAAREATQKAEAASDKRLEGMNEFRNALKDQAATFADKDQTDFRLVELTKRLDGMDSGIKVSTGKNQALGIIGVGGAWIVTTAIAIAAIVMRH